jgi:hypothetical protein
MKNENLIKYRSYDRIWELFVSLLFMLGIQLLVLKNNAEAPIIFYLVIFSISIYTFFNAYVCLDFKENTLDINFRRHSQINISEIKSIERIDSFYDKYTNKLNKLVVVYEGYNDVKFSTIENEKLIQTLLQLNPNIRIKK